MTLATDKQKFTPEEFLDLPDAVSYELVNGELVERKGSESSVIAAVIVTLLNTFIRGKSMGFIGGADCSYQCFADSPNKVRKPDVSFVRSGRLPDDRPPKGHTKIPPDLAVEVLSPGDVVSEVDKKVREYLQAGVRLIWVVNPEMRTVTIHPPADAKLGAITALAENQVISGEDVLPGFECSVSEFFRI
jgi:Uma2 family endonuclease